MYRLVYGSALEQVVRLVGAAAGVEEGEHARDEQRRLVMRDGVRSGEDRGGLAVLAVRAGEEERVDGREALVERAGLAHEAALDDGAAAYVRMLVEDELRSLDVDADVCPGRYGSAFEARRPSIAAPRPMRTSRMNFTLEMRAPRPPSPCRRHGSRHIGRPDVRSPARHRGGGGIRRLCMPSGRSSYRTWPRRARRFH